MNFYKRHLGDIAKACGHLSQGQMGAYDLLLDWLYANEKPLPLALESVHRIGRATNRAERANVDAVLSEFFIQTEHGYTQKRVGEEIAKATAQAITNQRIAAEREARRRERSEHESFNDSCTNGQPSQTPDTRHQTEAITLPNGNESPAAPEDAPAGKGPPACPQQRIIALYHDVLPELRRVREWNPMRQKLLARRWAEKPERQTLDWWRDYFAYVRKSRFLMGQTHGRDGRPFDCDLEWLVRPTNFAKVVEGRYEDPDGR